MTKRVAKLYKEFREKPPTRARRISPSTILPRGGSMMVMGYLDFLGYRTTIGAEARRYKHNFHKGSRALLCTDGKKLFIVGGRFHITERGIVDLTRNQRERE